MNNSSVAASGKKPERRKERGSRGRMSGETTAFEISAIDIAKAREQQQEPLFMVSRGVQKGRPIPIHEGRWTVGRGPICDVSVQGRGISRRHMRVEHSTNAGVIIKDAGSTNGLFVNGNRVEQGILHEGDVVQLGPETRLTFTYALASEIPLRVGQYEQTVVDDLTGIHNRRYLMESLEHEIAFAVRHDQPLHLLIVDVDRFKRVNDEYGHEAGDVVLKQIAELIADDLRSEDTVARLGGEEFAIVTRGMSADEAAGHADRLCKLVEAQEFCWAGHSLRCTISIGGAVLTEQEHGDIPALMRRADEYLYQAKDAGRNTMVIG